MSASRSLLPMPGASSLRQTSQLADQDPDEPAVTMSENDSSQRNVETPEGGSDTARTGSASSIRSRHQSSPSVASKTSEAPPTPESPPYRMTRKRTAAQLEKQEDENDSDDKTPTHSRIASADSQNSLSMVCICQPDPKIPRPRNAFILYRQHHQAAIVAHNPGLANPEISKIIGEQWRSQPAEVKSEWKALAEEEKIRHQQQYPEYRYQPRRNGRRGSIAESTLASSAVDKPRCVKCGGRNILTPTASTPISAREPPPILPPPTPSSGTTPTSRYLPMMNNLSLASPAPRRNRPGTGHHPAPLQLVGMRNPPEDADLDVLSPDTKRRRINNVAFAQIPGRPALGTPYPFPPPPQYQQRRESLPRPDPILARGLGPMSGMMMAPPPRPMHPPHQDPSLVLPPLQTGNDQSRSIEAMVMGMPFLGKIRVLGRIAQPFKASTSSSPASPKVRGAVVAIEGEHIPAVRKLTTWLTDFFEKSGMYDVRVVEGPPMPEVGKESSLLEFKSVAAEWHKRDRELVEFITSSSPPSGSDNKSTATAKANHGDGDTVSNDEETASRKPRTPLLLLPLYTLQASNAYAAAIPIQDAYSMMDHWQWVATLFRGTIGPDLTVYVRNADGSGHGQEGANVEVREEFRAMIVKSSGGAAGGIVEGGEASLRRLGFEVGEAVRGVCGGSEKGRS